MNFKEISDNELMQLCRNYGRAALLARNKFIGLLPEVNKRRLYAKKFVSVFHYGAVVGGVCREMVQRALNLSQKFEEMPHLLNLLVNGVVSVNKLRRIVAVAKIENEEELANLVQTLSKSALETLVKDMLINQAREREVATTANAQNARVVAQSLEIENGLFTPQSNATSGPGPRFGDTATKFQNTQLAEYVQTPPLSNEIKKKLNELAAKDIDINALIEEALIRREQEIAHETEIQTEKAEQKMIEQITMEKPASPYIAVKTRRLLKKQHGEKCAVPTCSNKSQEIHHTNRFSIAAIHDPRFMAPLCRQHHQIAHAVDVKAIEQRMR